MCKNDPARFWPNVSDPIRIGCESDPVCLQGYHGYSLLGWTRRDGPVCTLLVLGCDWLGVVMSVIDVLNGPEAALCLQSMFTEREPVLLRCVLSQLNFSEYRTEVIDRIPDATTPPPPPTLTLSRSMFNRSLSDMVWLRPLLNSMQCLITLILFQGYVHVGNGKLLVVFAWSALIRSSFNCV